MAINYNRKEGVSPLNRTRPLGLERGGGIWIHVDHEGLTQGCVSLPEERMEELLRTLDPEMNPVIVMGDAVSLRR
ncbi:lipoprotein [Streptomyces badius]